MQETQVPLEQRIAYLNTSDGKRLVCEVRRLDERKSVTVWVPDLREVMTLTHVNDSNRPDDYETIAGDWLTFEYTAWKKQETFTRIKVPKSSLTK